jgi:hypothetical protein
MKYIDLENFESFPVESKCMLLHIGDWNYELIPIKIHYKSNNVWNYVISYKEYQLTIEVLNKEFAKHWIEQWRFNIQDSFNVKKLKICLVKNYKENHINLSETLSISELKKLLKTTKIKLVYF